MTRVQSKRVIASGVLLLGLLLGGCKGCDEEVPPAVRTAQDERALRMARLKERMLDHGKAYPKAEDGSVACGKDLDCFLIQAERCTPASYRDRMVRHYLGMDEISELDYRIVARSGQDCVLTRHPVALDAKLDESMAKVLRERGQSEEQIARLVEATRERLEVEYGAPSRCSMTTDLLLDRLLDIADGKRSLRPWQRACVALPKTTDEHEAEGQGAPTGEPKAAPSGEQGAAPDAPKARATDEPPAADAPSAQQP